jgi:hypothetical protein
MPRAALSASLLEEDMVVPLSLALLPEVTSRVDKLLARLSNRWLKLSGVVRVA